jgi:hypothetical protein
MRDDRNCPLDTTRSMLAITNAMARCGNVTGLLLIAIGLQWSKQTVTSPHLAIAYWLYFQTTCASLICRVRRQWHSHMYIARSMWIYMYDDEQSTFESETVVVHATASSFSEACIPPIWRREQQQLTIMFTARRMWINMYYAEQSTLWLVPVVRDDNAIVECRGAARSVFLLLLVAREAYVTF